jgi:hypothetical protein
LLLDLQGRAGQDVSMTVGINRGAECQVKEVDAIGSNKPTEFHFMVWSSWMWDGCSLDQSQKLGYNGKIENEEGKQSP